MQSSKRRDSEFPSLLVASNLNISGLCVRTDVCNPYGFLLNVIIFSLSYSVIPQIQTSQDISQFVKMTLSTYLPRVTSTRMKNVSLVSL